MCNQTLQTIDAATFLESNLPLIEAVVGEVARRYRVRGDALDEFRSLVFLKLVEHDYAVLRRFQGASSLRTYLAVVLQRVLLDHRNREWGRWRASAAASRLGSVAVDLERLVTRDGLTPAEAIAALGSRAGVTAVAGFADTLHRRRGPVRGSRTTLGEEAIPDCLDPAPGPDARMERKEQMARAAAVGLTVRQALRSLSSQDHLLITLRYRDGLSVADAARVLDVDAKPLYRRIDRILAHVQAVLYTDELRGALAAELARHTWSDMVPTGESGWWRQSNPVNGTASNLPILARGGLSRRRSACRVHRRVRRHPVRSPRAASV